MAKKDNWTGPAIAGAAAVGSAALVAALLYTTRRKDKDKASRPEPAVPTGEAPETD